MSNDQTRAEELERLAQDIVDDWRDDVEAGVISGSDAVESIDIIYHRAKRILSLPKEEV